MTSTFPLLKLKMLPEFLRLFQDTLHLGEWQAGDHVFTYKDGETRIIFGSATNPESLESATAKAAWLDEVGQDQFRLESWEAVQRRLAVNQGRVLGGTTVYNSGWLKTEVFDKWKAGNHDFQVIQFPSITNPAYPRAEYERLKMVLPEWKFKMFCRGEFDKPEHLIYGSFSSEYREDGGHKVHAFEFPAEWPRHVGVDFGAINTATVWVTHDPASNVYYVYRETLEGNMTSKEHARKALERAKGVNVLTWTGGAASEKQPRWDWRAENVPVRESRVVEVEAGIGRIIGLWRTHRLFVFDCCRGLLDELGTYSRKLDKGGQATDEIADKQTFHRLDALRYACGAMERGPLLLSIM